MMFACFLSMCAAPLQPLTVHRQGCRAERHLWTGVSESANAAPSLMWPSDELPTCPGVKLRLRPATAGIGCGALRESECRSSGRRPCFSSATFTFTVYFHSLVDISLVFNVKRKGRGKCTKMYINNVNIHE